MTPEELFSVDLDGQRQSFDDLVADGLDRDYSARFDELKALVASGSPRDSLFAAAMLASWAQRDGYLAIQRWAGEPDQVPWASDPHVTDRFSGADASFAMLARALDTARLVAQTPEDKQLRRGATHALLAIYHRVFFDRDLFLLLAADDELAQASRAEIELAIEQATTASTRKQPFDMASQAAFLVGALAPWHDARAAAAADALLALHAGNTRACREVAYAMASGKGPATLAVLERLVKTASSAVRTEAEEALDRRRGKVTS